MRDAKTAEPGLQADTANCGVATNADTEAANTTPVVYGVVEGIARRVLYRFYADATSHITDRCEALSRSETTPLPTVLIPALAAILLETFVRGQRKQHDCCRLHWSAATYLVQDKTPEGGGKAGTQPESHLFLPEVLGSAAITAAVGGEPHYTPAIYFVHQILLSASCSALPLAAVWWGWLLLTSAEGG